MEEERWAYDRWPSGEPYDWKGAARSASGAENLDFHVDLGCGLVKKGRIGIDRFEAPGVDIICDFETLRGWYPSDNAKGSTGFNGGLPFESDSIKHVVSHHVLEHIGDGFPRLLDDVHRCLEPDGLFRIIVPLFPSHSALADPDHRRLFVEGTFEHLLAYEDGGFAVPYMRSRWALEQKDLSPPSRFDRLFTPEDRREMRVTLRAEK